MEMAVILRKLAFKSLFGIFSSCAYTEFLFLYIRAVRCSKFSCFCANLNAL